MASGSSACFRGFLLLVLAVVANAAAAAAAATAGAPAEAPARARQLLPRDRENSLPPPPPAGDEGEGEAAPGDAAACVRSVLEEPGPCARDVLETLVFKTVHLSEGCCRVLAGVGDKCIAAVFSGGAVGPALLPVVYSVCGLIGSTG